MSDTASPSATSTIPPQSAASKLDSMSKEDLIKFVKKQAFTIKGLRSQQSTEQSATHKSNQVDLAEEYSVLKSERDVLFQKFSALTSEKNILEHKYEQALAQLTSSELEKPNGISDTGAHQEDSMQSQIQRLEKDLSKSENECATLRSKLSSESSERRDDILEASEQKLRLLELELTDYQTNSKFLAEENIRLKDKTHSNEDILRENKLDRDSLAQQITTLESEKTSIIAEQTRLHTQIRDSSAGVDSLRAELDTERRSSEELRREMEQVRYQWEEDKLSNQKLEIKIHDIQQTCQTDIQSKVDSLDKLEQRYSDLEAKLRDSQLASDTVTSEYENYKIRVHGVLKQKSELVSSSQELQDKVSSLETSREELLRQLEKKETIISNLEGDVSKLRRALTQEEEGRSKYEKASLSRVESLQTSKNEQISRQGEEIQHLHELVEGLKQTEQQMEQSYAHQIQSMQREHQEKMASLQQENLRLQNITQVEEGEELPPYGLQERTQGEGMEREVAQLSNKPDSTCQSPTGHARGFYLERLLTNGPEEVTLSPEPQTEHSLSREVATVKRQLCHLNEILRESESNNMLLEQQVKLLKEEVRRLERNTQRGKHLESLEYLKNVVVRFFTSSSSQAEMLPALQTLLQLAPEEMRSIKSEIEAVAKMKKQAANSASFAWSSYDPTNINIV